MDMDFGWGSSLHILRDSMPGRTSLGTSYQDWLFIKNMIISEWETEHWLFGKDKDTIISLLAILLLTMWIRFKTLTTRQTLKECGLTFTILIVRKPKKQWPLSNMELAIYKQSLIRHLIKKPNTSDLYWEELMKRDIQASMVCLLPLHFQLKLVLLLILLNN